MNTALGLEDGFFVKAWSRGEKAHLAIAGKALCGIGDVRPVAFKAKLQECKRCQRVASAYPAKSVPQGWK